MKESTAREAIVEFGRSLYERGLAHGSTGNISVRLDDGWLLTPTNCCIGHMDPASLSRLDDGGRLLAGEPPSKEVFLHRAMYDVRSEAAAIVHLHSLHSVAVSCLPEVDPDDVFPPMTAYASMKCGRVALVPYFRPGDEALAQAVRAASGRHHAVLLANHGPVVAGRTLADAVYATEELEATARLYLLLRDAGPRLLTSDQLAELRASFDLD